MPRTTNHGVQPHVHLIANIPVVSQYVVSKDQNSPFPSIQAAIDQAVADGHESNSNSAVILIGPGDYIENITMYRGVYLQGFPATLESVRIFGTVNCALSAGPGPFVTDNYTSITGISIYCSLGDSVVFSGTNPQTLYMNECAIFTTNGRSIFISNSGVDPSSQSSLIIAESLRTTNLSGNPFPVVEIEEGGIGLTTSTVQHFDLGILPVYALKAGVSAKLVLFSNSFVMGGVWIGPSTGGLFVLSVLLINAGIVSALQIDYLGGVSLGQINILSSADPYLIGAGVAVLTGPVASSGGAAGVTVATLVQSPAEMSLISYHPGSAPAAAAWAGVPADLQTAIDRLAITVQALNGGVPIP